VIVNLTRRAFLRATAATATLTLLNLRSAGPAEGAVAGNAGAATGIAGLDYRGFEDIYRKRWTWDRVVKGTHYANCGYQRCAWNVYVKEGIVWREEQVAAYPQVKPDLPDFNPRGCQKGACYSNRMYDRSRLTAPLKRVGERGEGKWKRISWDEALAEIADKFIDVMISEPHAQRLSARYADLREHRGDGRPCARRDDHDGQAYLHQLDG